MGLRDILKKKDGLAAADEDRNAPQELAAPEFTFLRTDTTTQEVIQPPAHPEEYGPSQRDKGKHSLDIFHHSSSRSRSRGSVSSSHEVGSPSGGKNTPRRLSQRLHLSRQPPESSDVVPQDLPPIVFSKDAGDDNDVAQQQWEKRATILAETNDKVRGRPTTPVGSGVPGGRSRQGSVSPGVVSSKALDDDIQEAIRLHEAGDYAKSTKIFARLADPEGDNNPLSQVLYGLALRHGWGCEPDTPTAVKFLSAAAANAASVEQLALEAGLKKGGAAKGELVLAIFELANCFRHGWGIEKDAYAAKQYYETAANLGDTDAMNETAWCYLEGFGCKKDKYAAARYYRQAEKGGNKTLGNSWIWKDKYDPDGPKKKK